MKTIWIVLISVLLILGVVLPLGYVTHVAQDSTPPAGFYFGVTYGLNTTSQAEALIDRVEGFTNLFIVDSFNIDTNQTALTEICNYAVDKGLKIIVYFAYVSHIIYPWQIAWVEQAKERWGNMFLGIYYYDEPGGKQIDTGAWNVTPSVFADAKHDNETAEAAEAYIASVSSQQSMKDLKANNLTAYTSDYALYWFDYQAGYDVVFAELGKTRGLNENKTENMDLCRGAANVQGKQWGVIITWVYDTPPYLENKTDMLQDMQAAYRAGADYIVVFDFPQYPATNDYGVLTQDQFNAMEEFWNQIHAQHGNEFGTERAEAAFVLPQYYGSGLRSGEDKIWGLWSPNDTLYLSQAPILSQSVSSLIQDNMMNQVGKTQSGLDIIYNDTSFNIEKKYSRIHYWNSNYTS